MKDRKKMAAYIAAKHERFLPLAVEAMGEGKYQKTPYDHIINDALDKTFTGEIVRLVINISPRMGKTLRAVWAYVARGFAINPKSRFIHASYSSVLVNDNSSKIRDIISSPVYQSLYPYVEFKKDTTAKGLWKTTAGGSFLASPSGGSITGFGAGLFDSDIFSGSLILDDPLKPDDAFSDTKRQYVNQRWKNTFLSRLAHAGIPQIIIMQRIHEDDFTNEVLECDDGIDCHHIVLPSYVEDDYKYTQSGIYIPHNLPTGSLWRDKIGDKRAKMLSRSIQYSQEPVSLSGEVYQREWFIRFKELPANIKSHHIYCDTASKIKKYNDFSVFQLWHKSTENKGYLSSSYHDRVIIPQLFPDLREFYIAALKSIYPKEYGIIKGEVENDNGLFMLKWANAGLPKITISIEDKDSGTGLIQLIGTNIDDYGRSIYDVVAIQRKEGKYARALKASGTILAGDVLIIDDADGDATITEAAKFKKDDTHKHDDRIDPMNDFINYELLDSAVQLTTGNMAF